MAKRKKNTRLFPRDQRRAARQAAVAAVEKLSPGERVKLVDHRLILAYDTTGRLLRSPSALAEAWLHLRQDPDREPYETQALGAMQREFERVEGLALTIDTAEAVIDAADQDRREEWEQ